MVDVKRNHLCYQRKRTASKRGSKRILLPEGESLYAIYISLYKVWSVLIFMIRVQSYLDYPNPSYPNSSIIRTSDLYGTVRKYSKIWLFVSLWLVWNLSLSFQLVFLFNISLCPTLNWVQLSWWVKASWIMGDNAKKAQLERWDEV